MAYKQVNPVTGETVKEYDSLSFDDAYAEVKELRKKAAEWRNKPIRERLKLIKKLGEVLVAEKHKYGMSITKEIGKPIKDAESEVEKCASVCDYYYNNAETFLRDQEVKTDSHKTYVRFEPLGVVLGIVPWNYPFSMAFRSAVPALSAGNAYAMKTASNIPECSLAIREAFEKAGLSDYVKVLLITSEVASKIIETSLVDGVTFTGSTEAGKKIGELAGKNLKKMVLELGGSDAFIVLKDADVARAAMEAANSRFLNSGQNCNSAKRMIVVQEVAKEFEEKFVEEVNKLKVGDPSDPSTAIGPLATKGMVEIAELHVKDAIAKGARIVLGGKKGASGFYFMPTVITNVKPDMMVAREETFAPIAPIIVVKNEDEAIAEANKSAYGLGASVWTRDLAKGEALTHKLEAGSVFVNKRIRSDPRLPFGGIKQSGIGREYGEFGLKEFVNVKTVIIEK